MKEMGKTTTGRLNNGVPQIPPAKLPSDLTSFQQTLPVFKMSEVLIRAINDNKVILIAGETGSGKTTQVGNSFDIWKSLQVKFGSFFIYNSESRGWRIAVH